MPGPRTSDIEMVVLVSPSDRCGDRSRVMALMGLHKDFFDSLREIGDAMEACHSGMVDWGDNVQR